MTQINTPVYIIKPNLKKRIIATILDYTLVLLPTYMYIELFGQNNDAGGKIVANLMALPPFILWFIYFVFIESSYGSTLGYRGLNLKVLTTKRNSINFAHSLKRHLLDPIDIFFYGIPALIAIKNTEKHQRLGDLWAKTIVVDTKDPDQYEQ